MANAARAAKNENLFREVNEQIHKLEAEFGGEPEARFLCECSRRDCTTRVDMRLEEYRAIRADPRHFLVSRGHVDPEFERVVRSTDRFMVIEKFGLAGEIAEAEAG